MDPKQVNYGKDIKILDSILSTVLVHKKTKSENKIILLTNMKNIRLEVDLNNTSKYGVGCSNFKLLSLGRTIYILFTYNVGLNTYLRIITLEIYETDHKTLVEEKFPFNINKLEFCNDNNFIYVGFKEALGDEIRVWRIERRRADINRISLKARIPGDMSLVSNCEFQLVDV